MNIVSYSAAIFTSIIPDFSTWHFLSVILQLPFKGSSV
jgi:hypothetical protein